MRPQLVNLGPGRGEAPVFGGDGAFRSLPYYTLDLTSSFSKAGSSVIAVECMHQGGANVIVQLQLRTTAGGKMTTIGTDATWSVPRPQETNPQDCNGPDHLCPSAGWLSMLTSTATRASRSTVRHPGLKLNIPP